MKAIILEAVGGQYQLVDNVEKPSPGPKQILVKSLATAINPVEGFMQSTGMLITSFPIVLGCDASGIVVEVGEQVKKFKVGDGIYGCTRLGTPGYSTFQEYFLMDEDLTFKKAKALSTEQAATIGVGALTAALGLIIGTKMEFTTKPLTTDSPWVIILGAAGSVGQFAIQIAKLCGYKVLGSCSPRNNEMLQSVGADASFDYKLSLEEQLAEIEKFCGGKFSDVFDASAMATETGMTALQKLGSKSAAKHFSTVNDWVPIEPKEGVEIFTVTLGEIGRSGSEHIKATNRDIKALIPKIEESINNGSMKPLEYIRIGDVGIEGVLKALEAFGTHKSGKKIVARLAHD